MEPGGPGGGPLRADPVDSPETAPSLPPARASFQCASRSLIIAGTIWPRRATSLTQQAALHGSVTGCRVRVIDQVRDVCSACLHEWCRRKSLFDVASPVPGASSVDAAPASRVRGMHSETHISPSQCRKPRVG